MRVLVVEDSMTVRKRIVELLEQADGVEVVGEAPDGKQAIELCELHRPDVISMDMMLPVMTGLAATEYIMAHAPTPILIVSASTNRGELFRTYDALAAGAVDVLEKPLRGEPDEAWGCKLVAALQTASHIRVITHLRGRRRPSLPGAATTLPNGPAPRVIAIGASTGGPAAVREVLRSLPPTFPLPILLVIHIAESFGAALAEWLSAQTGRTVRYALDGEAFPPADRASVLMAPPGRHLEIAGSRLRLTGAPERHACRPSVDVLFESLASEVGSQAVACLLTGMGKDGAQGLLAVKQQGGHTIVQDRETAVVFGMPGEALRLGAAAAVLPLAAIGPSLARLATVQQPSRSAPR